MDGVDVVYWINLPSAVERRKHMKKVLSDDAFKTIPKVRMVASPPIPQEKLLTKFKIPDSSLSGMSINRTMREVEYACLLSHLNTLRKFSESSYETALILEDDVTLELKPYWTSLKKIMEEAPKDWEILKLNSHTYYKPHDPIYVKITFPCYDSKLTKKGPSCKWSAAAYVIKKEAAKKLMKMWDGKRYHLPENTYYVADYLLYDVLTTYDYKYQYFMIRANNDTQVQMKPSTSSTRRRRKIMALNKSKKL